jgi:hypothetical protein
LIKKRREESVVHIRGKGKEEWGGSQQWPALGVLTAQAREKVATLINGGKAEATSKAET